MTIEKTGSWHVELDDYGSFAAARSDAQRYDGYPAWIQGSYVVRVGNYGTKSKAQEKASELGGNAKTASSASTSVQVVQTQSNQVLFEFDGGNAQNLGVHPKGKNPATWFRNNKYRGGFEYLRAQNGGNLSVINVLNLEDYVKGVIPNEMITSWPLAALEAQAVCARTFACYTTKHQKSGFDLCTSTDCQVYKGLTGTTEQSDQAVDNTRDLCLYYQGKLIESVYHSSDGGATESAVNVWGNDAPYLIGKQDPYDSDTASTNYTTVYTAKELTEILHSKGYNLGTVQTVYVSEFTPLGNVSKVTFIDTAGKSVTVKGDTCRTVFSSSTYQKSVKSLRFTINGAEAPVNLNNNPNLNFNTNANTGTSTETSYPVNGTGTLSTLDGKSVLTNSGMSRLEAGKKYQIITESGISEISIGKQTQSTGNNTQVKTSTGSNIPVSRPASDNNSGTFTITGTGYGHQVGMSQTGAKNMAQQGFRYQDILFFYYTNVELRQRTESGT